MTKRQKHFHMSPPTAEKIGPELALEIESMAAIADALAPLTRPEQARVLLMAISKLCPDGFTEQQLLHLLRIGCKRMP